MSIRRMMLFTLGGFFKSIISLFKTRVLSDGGNFEAETNLENQLNTLGSDLFNSASLVITPNGVKTSKLYTIKPNDGTGDLTVTRNTSATRVNESGVIVDVPANVARIDYSNGSPAILVEPQRTNLLLRSEEFDNAYWIKINTTVTANATISPDGTMSADLVANTSYSGFINNTDYVGSTGIVYSFSFYIKNNTSTSTLILVRFASTALSATINWSGANISSITNTIGSISFTALTNGWFLIKGTYTATENNQQLRVFPQSVSGTNSVFLWGAQLEVGSNATSYIPTVESTVTRNADVISKTGISSLIGQTEGTMYWEGVLTRNSSTERLIAISNSALSNRVVLNINNNRIELINRSNSTIGNGSIAGSSLSEIQNGLNKIAVRYQSGNTALYVNGVLVSQNTQTFNYTSAIDRLFMVSSEVNSSNNNNASTKLAILSNNIFNNQQLQQLTTL